MPAQKKYDEETQIRAVRMYRDRLAEGDLSQLATRTEVGEMRGVTNLRCATGSAASWHRYGRRWEGR